MEQVKVKLSRPIQAGGDTVSEVTIKEEKFNVALLTKMAAPVLRWNESLSSMTWEAPIEMEQLSAGMEFIFGFSPKEVEQISAKDFKKIAEAMAPFLVDSPEETGESK